MKNALVLGGTGFLGSAVARKLMANHFFTRVYSPSAQQNESAIIEAVNGSIEDLAKLEEQIKWADIIFHFVSTTTPKTSESDPVRDIESNVLPFIRLLESIKKNKQVKFVFCSSGGAVYGKPQTTLIREEHPRNPLISYGLVKKTMEDYVLYYHQRYGLPYLILRPSNIYGPKTKSIGSQGIISTLVMNSLRGEATHIWSDTEVKKDYLFVEDFADAVMSLINNEGVYNIGSGSVFSVHDIIDMVASQMGHTQSLVYDQREYDEVPALLDISKIVRETRWTPATTLQKGIAETIQHIKSFTR